MLKLLKLSGVGPAPEMQVDFAPRINVLTGDNGLGKSFILDVAWWALTQRWAGEPAWPRPEARQPTIDVKWEGGRRHYPSKFNFPYWTWPDLPSRSPANDVLTVFARVDGGFSLCDPYREALPDPMVQLFRGSEVKEPAIFNFNPSQIWEGLRQANRSVCEGVERDWVSWQSGGKPEFENLSRALNTLSPPEEQLVPGQPMRISLGEGFDRPTIKTATGVVPVKFASAGVRRILAVAYLLVWAITEHKVAAKLTRREPVNRMVILFDEPETHLHPKWQRTIIPSVLAAVSELTGIEIQLITATHSPLVLASLEPIFDAEKDSLIDLHLEGKDLQVSQVPWRRRGDVTAWLTSEIFDLKSARSVEAEEALEEAATILSEEPPNKAKAKALDQKLRGLLGEMDPFWIRWRYLGEKQGWLE